MALGQVLAGRFELVELAGSGGMAKVYRALDRLSGETVAVKLVSQLGAPLTERFAREVRVLSELSHPGIVRYVAHGTTPDGEPFLAMEWLDGEDLAARLHRGALGLSETLWLISQ